MAANMQHMAGGQMMPQQLRKPAGGPLQQIVYQNLSQHMPPPNGPTWQSNVALSDRMGKTMDLITNITLAITSIDMPRATDYGCNFEREVFLKSPSKEAYDSAMASKTMGFFKKRQANEPNLQNSLSVNAQAQAQQAHAQVMMMHAKMGRGAGQAPQQGFQHLQPPMQGSQMPPQPPQPPQTQQQMLQQQQQLAGMANQAGRGMGPNQPPMGLPGGQTRMHMVSNDFAALGNNEKSKVIELAQKMMAQASEPHKNTLRMQLQQRLSPQQLAELQAAGRDPVIWFFQNQAFQAFKNSSMNRFQAGMPQNQGNPQAAMMQQQHSQQSLQQRLAMMNNAQGAGPNPEMSQFTPNMESIKDQQMTGFIAQQAGQMVVPASGTTRTGTSQPGNQPMPNQQIQNPAARAAQQQQQQQQPPPPPPQQHQQQQQQQQQQMKLNQSQQSQAQMQMQGQLQQQMQGQQQMVAGIPVTQSPGMNTLNTPVSRPAGNMAAMGAQGMGPGMAQGGIQFGDQRFNQGIQRPNNQAFNAMLANIAPEERQALNGLPPEKINELVRRWNNGQDPMAMNGAQMMPGQMANRPPPNQFGQVAANMPGGPGPSGMPQSNMPGAGNGQQQMPMRMQNAQNTQLQALMDAMDLPPNIIAQIGQLPVEVKKWRDLKAWITQNNALPPNVRNQLLALQQKQFQQAMLQHKQRAMAAQQSGQNPNMNQVMAGGAGQMGNQQPGMQRPIPPQMLQVSAQDVMNLRNTRPNLAHMSDDQLRQLIIQMRRTSWLQLSQQHRAQNLAAQMQNQQQQPGQPPVTGPQAAAVQPSSQPSQQQQQQQQQQAPQAPQPVRTPQPQTQPAPNNMVQTPQMQTASQKAQSGTTPNRNQARNQPQPPKNLKRPSPDDGADTVRPKPPAPTPTSRPASQSSQQLQQQQQSPPHQPQGQKPMAQGQLAQQEANMSPEQRAKFEQMKKNAAAGPNAAAEAISRLKMIGQEEQKAVFAEPSSIISMSPEEFAETSAKLKRTAADMNKIGRSTLGKWYTMTRDDARAKMFFRMRFRFIKQFADGEAMKTLRDGLSIRGYEVDESRALLESMVKDVAAVTGRNVMKPGAPMQAQKPPQQQQDTPQTQAAQLPPPPPSSLTQQQQQQQQKTQSQSAPLNAANLEKNTQALSKQSQKAAAKANQVPPAPTTTQPPFPFGATSPHGNPAYASKPKDLNLQLPTSRKKQKLSGSQPAQPSQGATPSPQISKNGSPDLRRAQVQAKPAFVCTEKECEMSTIGFATEQALQVHVEEEHVKPKEDPIKFVQENLALALGLEPDGTVKKEQKMVEIAPAMSLSVSKQGQTPGNVGNTPMSQDGTGMKRSASAMQQDGGRVSAQTEAASKIDGAMISLPNDPWAGSTIDPQTLLQNLGFENGLPNIVAEASMYRALTPNDTPESSKDSGSSEPNSDISEGVAIDIDMDWQNLDTDLVMNLTNSELTGDFGAFDTTEATLDPSLLMDPSASGLTNWADFNTDFSKPYQHDMSLYSMDI